VPPALVTAQISARTVQQKAITNVDHRFDAVLVSGELVSQSINIDVQAFRVNRLVISPGILPKLFSGTVLAAAVWATFCARPRRLFQFLNLHLIGWQFMRNTVALQFAKKLF
jgi:hypothetical protein